MAGVYWFVFTELMTRAASARTRTSSSCSAAMLPWQWASAVLRLVDEGAVQGLQAGPVDQPAARDLGAAQPSGPSSRVPLRAPGARRSSRSITARRAELARWCSFPLAMLLQTMLLTGLGLLLAPAGRALRRHRAASCASCCGCCSTSRRSSTACNDVTDTGRLPAQLYVLNPLAGIFDLYRIAFFPDSSPAGRRSRVAAVISVAVLRRRASRLPPARGPRPQGDLMAIPSSRPTTSASSSRATGAATSGCATCSPRDLGRSRPASPERKGARATSSGRCATSRSTVAAGRGRRPRRRQRPGQEHAAQADRRRAAARRGHVAVNGGVAPLIEITGGFVGDLTARDNIWLTAGLHGLSQEPRSPSGSTRSSTSPRSATSSTPRSGTSPPA